MRQCILVHKNTNTIVQYATIPPRFVLSRPMGHSMMHQGDNICSAIQYKSYLGLRSTIFIRAATMIPQDMQSSVVLPFNRRVRRTEWTNHYRLLDLGVGSYCVRSHVVGFLMHEVSFRRVFDFQPGRKIIMILTVRNNETCLLSKSNEVSFAMISKMRCIRIRYWNINLSSLDGYNHDRFRCLTVLTSILSARKTWDYS